ncbi:MAG TPA: pyrroline-5-carboxylate reductase [Burkholderiales bacterium]|nr:pyrroline-5-carboxylate reductase [Burkholderiales bacterium]
MSIAFIGGGNMATALIVGMLKKGRRPQEIHVVDIEHEARERLAREQHVSTSAAMDAQLHGAECIVLAVKPQNMRDVARGLAPFLRAPLVITIAAGVRYADLSRWLGGHTRIVRAMPNTPALALAGVTGLYAPASVSKDDRNRAEQILGAAGSTLWVETEEEIDAVTAVSGSGPAYVFYFIEALQEAAVDLGFSPDAARLLALETFRGAVKLAVESPEPPATLRARVTSKGGTTERAIAELERSGVRKAILKAARAAAGRSRELGIALGADSANDAPIDNNKGTPR